MLRENINNLGGFLQCFTFYPTKKFNLLTSFRTFSTLKLSGADAILQCGGTNIQCFLLRKRKGTQIRNCCSQKEKTKNYPKRSTDRSKSTGFILYFQESTSIKEVLKAKFSHQNCQGWRVFFM